MKKTNEIEKKKLKEKQKHTYRETLCIRDFKRTDKFNILILNIYLIYLY